MKKLIYIVDDEPLQLHYLQAALRKSNYQVQSFSDPYELLDALDARIPDAVVVDLVMPTLSGLELIKEIRKHSQKVPLIAVTAYPEIETAVGAVRAGANDYLKKPFQTAELQLVVERLLEAAHLRDNLDSLVEKNSASYSLDSFIGDSEVMRRVKVQLQRLVDMPDANVLITGQKGSGKSFAARILHYAHPDVSKRLIEVNCAALSKEDLEAELFGTEITQDDGTVIHHPSLCEVAEGGTILLDYLTEMDLSTQKKLYKHLSNLSARAQGDGESFYPCRIIVSSTLDPESEKDKHAIDPDLYNYLTMFHLRMPTLIERGDDILALATRFIAGSESRTSVRISGLTPEAEQELMAYEWPGNVRELKSVIERALVTTQTNLIDVQDLHIGATYHTKGDESTVVNTLTSLRELEIEQIRRVLTYTHGDVTKAAQILGISRKSLWERRKRYSLD